MSALELRQQLRTRTPQAQADLRIVPSTPRSVEEAHRQIDALPAAPSAQVSIESAKALFSKNHRQRQFRMAFDSLLAEQRALVLIAASIHPDRCHNNFDGFDAGERSAICNGLKTLSVITRRFQSSVGNLATFSPRDLN